MLRRKNMDLSYFSENRRERERLCKLVNNITEDELGYLLYKEGWTVAVALAHLAFWDQRRLILLRLWKQNGVTPSPMDADVVNNTLLPFFLELPPRKAASLAVLMAEELDREIEQLAPEFAESIMRSNDPHALNRGVHRKTHLEDIENLLKKTKRKHA
jgi:hypothetical protein